MIFDTQAEAEAASNQMFRELHPEGTTELLYGWERTEEGKYRLVGTEVPTE